jgi:hypothetical protein
MDNKTIKVFWIQKRFAGHGHYRIVMEYNKSGAWDLETNIEVSFLTTDMQSIDIWNEGGAEALAEHYLLNNVNSEAKIIFDF